MSKEIYYKIDLLNWDKHNPKHKVDFKKTMISNNFCTDSKLAGLCPSSHLLYLALILERSSTDERLMIISRTSVQRYMKARRSTDEGLIDLEQLQLLRYEKITPLLRKEGTQLKERKSEVVHKKEAVEKLVENVENFSNPESSTLNFHERFSSDYEKWVEVLNEAGCFRLRNKISLVKSRFKTIEELRSWVNEEVINSKSGKKVEDSGLKSYVAVALQKELGLL